MLHIVSSRQRRYTRSVCDTVVVRQKTRMLSHLLGLFLFCLSTHTLTARHRAYLQTLLGRIAWAESKGTAYCYRCSLICVSVCLSAGHSRKPYKMAEPIDIPFGMWTRAGPRNYALGGEEAIMGRGALPCGAAFCQNSLTACYNDTEMKKTWRQRLVWELFTTGDHACNKYVLSQMDPRDARLKLISCFITLWQKYSADANRTDHARHLLVQCHCALRWTDAEQTDADADADLGYTQARQMQSKQSAISWRTSKLLSSGLAAGLI